MNIISVAGPLLIALISAGPTPAGDDPAPIARRLAATVQLAAQEYRVGMLNGRIVAEAEIAEARLFLAEARRSSALLPPAIASEVQRDLDAIRGLVDRTAPPDTIDARVHLLAGSLARQLNIVLDQVPASAPSLARGASVYQANCAACHGAAGRGDGPAAAGLQPRPANLADADALRGRSPLDYYRRVTIGVVGTAMPAFESRLSADDRWAAATYATLLRLPAPAGDVPSALRAFTTTAVMSDSALVDALDERAAGGRAMAHVAAVRSFASDVTPTATTGVFTTVRAQIDSAFDLAQSGRHDAASNKAFDAYMTFEQVERSVRARNPAIARELESAFAALRARAAGGATSAELATIRRDLAGKLENAERTVADRLSPLNLFTQSFILLVREGLEAILIVGALMTFLVKTGASHRRRDIHIGVGAAVGASLLTAVALETIFQLTPAKREAVEGLTMVVATVVLFYVSYWLLSKMEVVKWNHFVKSKVQEAVTSGSSLALASAAFLAVYREGFETVLFYKALFLSGGSGGTVVPVVAGIALGAVVLVAVYVAINRFGVRLPLKPFFGFTSAFLYYMAFVFAGQGVAELQEGGLVPTTVLPWAEAIRVPSLGIYATLETLAAQGILLLLLLLALVWNFVVEPRRLRVTSVMVPEPVPAAAAAASPAAPAAAIDLLRSLDRMETDLAELRAETERMRRYIGELKPDVRRQRR